jgi:2-polyprenyl-6-methoxyphenol hydroxylase-like FAD-dependent oxidoreductase
MGAGKTGWWASVNKSLLDQKHVDGADTSVTHSMAPEDHASIRAELLRLFDGWSAPVPDLIRATPLATLVKNRVCDRQPVRKWGEACLTLIGDAIHPVTPNLGQGGCLAIEDAAVLARCLEKYASHSAATKAPLALRRFEAIRYSRTAWVTRCSRAYGIVGQWENGRASLRNRLMPMVPGRIAARALRSIFEYDAYGINI